MQLFSMLIIFNLLIVFRKVIEDIYKMYYNIIVMINCILLVFNNILE